MTDPEPETEKVATEAPLTDPADAPDGDAPESGAGYGNHADPGTTSDR